MTLSNVKNRLKQRVKTCKLSKKSSIQKNIIFSFISDLRIQLYYYVFNQNKTGSRWALPVITTGYKSFLLWIIWITPKPIITLPNVVILNLKFEYESMPGSQSLKSKNPNPNLFFINWRMWIRIRILVFAFDDSEYESESYCSKLSNTNLNANLKISSNRIRIRIRILNFETVEYESESESDILKYSNTNANPNLKIAEKSEYVIRWANHMIRRTLNILLS